MNTSFYNDRKFCPDCDTYVSYLASMEHSYCVDCGSQVRLFSKDDWSNFHDNIKARRPKGGRPKKNQGAKETA